MNSTPCCSRNTFSLDNCQWIIEDNIQDNNLPASFFLSTGCPGIDKRGQEIDIFMLSIHNKRWPYIRIRLMLFWMRIALFWERIRRPDSTGPVYQYWRQAIVFRAKRILKKECIPFAAYRSSMDYINANTFLTRRICADGETYNVCSPLLKEDDAAKDDNDNLDIENSVLDIAYVGVSRVDDHDICDLGNDQMHNQFVSVKWREDDDIRDVDNSLLEKEQVDSDDIYIDDLGDLEKAQMDKVSDHMENYSVFTERKYVGNDVRDSLLNNDAEQADSADFYSDDDICYLEDDHAYNDITDNFNWPLFLEDEEAEVDSDENLIYVNKDSEDDYIMSCNVSYNSSYYQLSY